LIGIKADGDSEVIHSFGGPEAMPITDIVILSGIVFAFLTFTVVLAWGDHQTKEIARLSRKTALFGSDAHVVALKHSVEAEKTEQRGR
jgi:hypothetical protein